MYLVNLRSGWKLWLSVLFSIMLIVGWAITPAQAHDCTRHDDKSHKHCNGGGGGGGGGKPPKDDPPPPEDFNPVIAISGSHKGKGRGPVQDIIMVMEADGSTKQVVVDTSDGLFDVARGV